ncbi:uncharacterized protein LOC110975916 isoform X3 [Acanthaster planci]|uniref:Uncharacterized protein LOC110975916 isoform X3 n=1 Tax=Acanthaster planci TaxID=133434 RepID=A0A8B7XXG3_ACAPL|nr:uncharacterized protein LOC110975916 isoform X3 [Acanthaster planci]
MEPKVNLYVCVALCLLLQTLPASDAIIRRVRRRGVNVVRKTEDSQPPVLVKGTCPSTMTVYVDSPSSKKIVQWSKPRASDKSPPVSVSREDGGPLNGGYFNASSSPYHVKYSATDAVGNKRIPICSFTVNVKVEDKKPPK